MKKTILIIILVVIATLTTYAQNIFPSSGNAGIGTTSPTYPLSILAGVNGDEVNITNNGSGNATIQYHTSSGGNSYIGQVNGSWGGLSTSSPAVFESDHPISITPVLNNPSYGINLQTNGSLGLGTTTPGAKLDVGYLLNSGDIGTVMARLYEGNGAGAGTYLAVKGYDTQLNSNTVNSNPTDVKSFAIEHSFYGQTNSSINFLRGGNVTGGYITFCTNNNTEKMRIMNSGNVLIGKTIQQNGGYILDVNGSVRANQIVVNNNGADFVFNPSYHLLPLSYLAKYLKENHHLPKIASAKQMQTDGLNLGDNQTRLLQKVEELTLYLIEKDKQVKSQQQQITQQAQQLHSQQEQIDLL